VGVLSFFFFNTFDARCELKKSTWQSHISRRNVGSSNCEATFFVLEASKGELWLCLCCLFRTSNYRSKFPLSRIMPRLLFNFSSVQFLPGWNNENKIVTLNRWMPQMSSGYREVGRVNGDLKTSRFSGTWNKMRGF